jgi:hypothetical protein
MPARVADQSTPQPKNQTNPKASDSATFQGFFALQIGEFRSID